MQAIKPVFLRLQTWHLSSPLNHRKIIACESLMFANSLQPGADKKHLTSVISSLLEMSVILALISVSCCHLYFCKPPPKILLAGAVLSSLSHPGPLVLCMRSLRWILTLHGRDWWLHGDCSWGKKQNLCDSTDIMLTICLTRAHCKSERGLKWTLVVVSYFRVYVEFVILNLHR